MLVIWLGQNTKPIDILIIHYDVSNNQPIPGTTGCDNNWVVYVNWGGVLESDQVCANFFQ